MGVNDLRWIQLSDIHYSYDNFDTTRMRDALLVKLKEVSSADKIEFLAITGDLAYKQSKYSKAMKDFLEKTYEVLHIDKSNVFLVPGNHDVKRNSVRTILLNEM